MESRNAIITIGQNWRVRPVIYDAFIRFRHAYSYSRTTDALQHCLTTALTVLGFLHEQQIKDVWDCVRFDIQTERRLQHCMDITSCTRGEAVTLFTSNGGEDLERSLYAPLRKREGAKEGVA